MNGCSIHCTRSARSIPHLAISQLIFIGKSTMTPGMLTLAELSNQAAAGEIETVLVVFTDLYGRFMGKRFDAGYFLSHVAKDGTHACDYLLTVDMEMDPVPGYRYSNWERGYGDFHLVPDPGTLRRADWLDKTAMVLCDVADPATHASVPFAPRSILKAQIARAAEHGYSAMAGSELEYYIFRESYRDAAKGGHAHLEPAGWYVEDYHALQGTRTESFNAAVRRHLAASGVPVECTKGEWGKGQHELNVRYSDVLTMADNHVVYKQCLKEVADRQGISVTFMAKYAADQAGSSCHLHLSLWGGGESAFAGQQGSGGAVQSPRNSPSSILDPRSSFPCSDVFRWFLGGWMKYVPDLMVCYAPTVNSYKRYVAASWAPTRVAWSRDNRTAGFRIVGEGNSLRIECRLPGADCNPYLAYAAALASGLEGIARRVEPPACYEGDAYAATEIPHVPKTLDDALALFHASAFAKSVFGEAVVEHYSHFFRTECEAYRRAVTDWERQRYFERI